MVPTNLYSGSGYFIIFADEGVYRGKKVPMSLCDKPMIFRFHFEEEMVKELASEAKLDCDTGLKIFTFPTVLSAFYTGAEISSATFFKRSGLGLKEYV